MTMTLDQFLGQISKRAFRFAELGLRNRDDALDAVQDAMLRMMRYKDNPSEEWSPLFWRILRTRIIDIQRRSSFRLKWMFSNDVASRDPSTGEEFEPDWNGVEHDDPSGILEAQQAYASLSNALTKLPARQREAFFLRVIEQFDVAETAQIMGCSEGSVKTHLSRARAALGQALGMEL